MRRTIALNEIVNVASSSKAVVKLSDALAYHHLLLTFTNIALNKIGRIRVFYGDKEAHSWASGADLDAILQYHKMPAFGATTQLLIPLVGLGMLEQAQEEFSAVHVGVPYADGTIIESMRVEIDLGSGLASPEIKGKGVVRDAVKGRQPWFPFTRETAVDVQSTGLKTVADMVDRKSNRESYCHMVAFKCDSTQLTNLLIQRNGVDMFDRNVVENNRIQAAGVRAPQAGWFFFDTRENGYGEAADALSAGDAVTLPFKPTFGASGTFTAYVCTIGRLS